METRGNFRDFSQLLLGSDQEFEQATAWEPNQKKRKTENFPWTENFEFTFANIVFKKKAHLNNTGISQEEKF
jgi:hypothetical protein